MTPARQCILFFHGNDGHSGARAMGGLRADTLEEALVILEQRPPMPAHDDLAGLWCCSVSCIGDEGPEHPATCQYSFRLSARGEISEAAIIH